jgi:MoaA/NifB/PqqE/SkfB family radical SAM enzyme
MDRVDLKLGFACNNRCVFCVQGNKREEHGARSLERIRHDLREGRRRGAIELVITGGEPTLQQHLLKVIRLARQLGYQRVQIQTNGRRFVYTEACQAAVAAGANEFSPALHGATAETHDRLTSAPGSHEQTLGAIRNLVGLGQRVVTNTVITSLNFEELPDLARLFVSLGVYQFQFAYVHIVGTAADNSAWLVPRKRDVMPFVFEGLRVGSDAGVRCMTEAIPLCLMRGHEDFVAERIMPDAVVFDADQVINDYTAYRRGEGKAKRSACAECRWDQECEGPWREYPELFGWDEFVPVPREERASEFET